MGSTETNSKLSAMEKTVSLTAKLKNFSSELIHKPGVLTAISDVSLEEFVIEFLIAAFYGNGNNEDNKGYVSIDFNCNVPLIFKKELNFNFSCVVAVRDVDGNKKFVRTFTFPYAAASQNAGDDFLTVYNIDRYIARETLLNDQDTLLPDDRLTLLVDVHLQAILQSYNSDYIESIIDSSFEVEESSSDPVIVLYLNSELSRYLYESSSYFRALCNTPMIENSIGMVHLIGDKVDVFRKACRILMGAKWVTFQTIDEIFDLYILADKYDIQNVIRACRSFCQKVLEVENAWGSFDLVEERIDKISWLATTYDDDILKEIVNRFLRNLKEDAIESRRKCEHRNAKLGNVKCEYTGVSPYLYFDLEEENDEDRSNFEFYN